MVSNKRGKLLLELETIYLTNIEPSIFKKNETQDKNEGKIISKNTSLFIIFKSYFLTFIYFCS